MVNTEIRLIIFFAAEDGEVLYGQQKQDWELTVAQIINSLLQNSDLKKVGKTTRPFRYDLNQFPYDYTVDSRSLSGGGGKRSCPSPSAGDLRELPRVPLRTPEMAAHQAPPSLGFSRQEPWSKLPFPSSGHLPNPGWEVP